MALWLLQLCTFVTSDANGFPSLHKVGFFGGCAIETEETSLSHSLLSTTRVCFRVVRRYYEALLKWVKFRYGQRRAPSPSPERQPGGASKDEDSLDRYIDGLLTRPAASPSI